MRDIGVSGLLIYLLIRSFPREFRERHGDEMLSAYLDCRDALSDQTNDNFALRRMKLARFFFTNAFGLIRAASAERFKARRSNRQSPNRGSGTMTDLLLNMRYGFRSLKRTPGFTLIALITLALGIGATTAMFSVLDTALRQSLPFPEAERLVMGRATFSGRVNPFASFPDYLDYRDQSQSLESLATIGFANLATVTGTGEPEQARIVNATTNLFSTLGVSFHLGGPSNLDELPRGGGGDVVISHSFWQRWFGADPNVIGRSIDVEGDPLAVVGVLPPGFRFMYDADMWVPPWPGNHDPVTRKYHNWFLVGRLAPGATLESARAEVDVISAQLQEAYPESNETKALQLDSLQSALVEGYRQSLLLLSGAILLVLMIACGNVANLLLARGSSRMSELAVRTAMGATRTRIFYQLLVECLLLAVGAGVLGLILAVWFQNLILGFVSMDLLGVEQAGLSPSMLAIALSLSILTVLLFGIVPSVSAARSNTAEKLKQGGRTSTSGSGVRYRSALVVFQVALSLVLLVGSGLLIRSFSLLRSVDPGFRVDNILTATVSLPSDGYREPERRVQFFEQLKESIEALPSVESASMVSRFPIVQAGGNYAIWSPERPPETLQDAPGWADFRIVLPGYFGTMEIPLVEGRVLDRTDDLGAPPVVVLTRTAANLVYPDESAVGRQLAVDSRDGPDYYEIVGVVEDHQTMSLAGTPRPAMFFPHAQQPSSTLRLAIAASTDPTDLIRPIQERIWEQDRDIVLSEPLTAQNAVSNSVADTRSVTTVLGLFAAAALALASLGLYGVLAFFVSKRIHEIGIRVALGAPAARVLRLVMVRGLALVGTGILLGTVGALGATRLVEGMLFNVSARDPATFVGVTAFFVFVAVAACLVPALRALRVDPLDVLRLE